ncbi:MAG TPA: VOC family protein [Candidatus Bathyarchaeia archaeon]
MQSVTSKVNPIPQDYGTVTPYLIVNGVPRLIDFLKETFHAEERARINDKKDHVGHAEVKIGNSMVMMADSTTQYTPIPSQLYVYVDNVDDAYRRAMRAGGTSEQEPTTQFYGDRTAAVKDPTGNVWWIATHVEDLSPQEMEKRMKDKGFASDTLTPT